MSKIKMVHAGLNPKYITESGAQMSIVGRILMYPEERHLYQKHKVEEALKILDEPSVYIEIDKHEVKFRNRQTTIDRFNFRKAKRKKT